MYLEFVMADGYRMRCMEGEHFVFDEQKQGYLWFLGLPKEDVWVSVGFSINTDKEEFREALFSDNSERHEKIVEFGRSWEEILNDPQAAVAIAQEHSGSETMVGQNSRGEIVGISNFDSFFEEFKDSIIALEDNDLEEKLHSFLEAPAKKSMSFKDFKHMVLDEIKSQLESIDDPNGDLVPQVYIENQGRILQMGLDPYFFDTDQHKEMVIQKCLLPTVKVTKARKFAFISAGWMLPDDEYEGGHLSEYFNSEEVMQVSVCDAEVALVAIAGIERDGITSPNLSDWTEGPSAGSRFIDPIQRAMR